MTHRALAFVFLSTICQPLPAQDEIYEGTAANGKNVFAREGCGVCHKIDGKGGDLGPDLSHIGVRTAAYIKQSIREPDAEVAPAYRLTVVTTAAGAVVRGVAIAEDDASLELRDMTGKRRSFRKTELKEVRREPGSPMPAYVMPATDLDNLVAYLKERK
jgi:quinoprotein glucose dehydrogenase